MASSARPQPFLEFVARLRAAPDSLTRFSLIQGYVSRTPVPVVEGKNVHFLFRGAGKVVAVPGEMNGWNPSDAVMERVPRTNVFFRTYSFPTDARVEYKIWVDSTWMLDPLNIRKARGGYGENSDLWMPGYSPPDYLQFDPSIPHGKIDTIWFSSTILNRTYPIFIYMPPGADARDPLPTIFVTDGGEYLSLARMNIVLDNLLAGKRIRPVLGVFIDPRTDLHDASSNRRMADYAANDRFLDFLEKELAPHLAEKYPVAKDPGDRLIIGASMGGLISTYAVLKRSDFISSCAAQSPAYLQADNAVIKLARAAKRVQGKIHIDTGTIHDAHREASLVKQLLEKRGAKVKYLEVHEGHNWSNWRARLGAILEHFFPAY